MPISAEDLVRREVGHCVSSLVSVVSEGVNSLLYRRGEPLNELVYQAQELCSPKLDYEEAATQAGWTVDGGLFVHHPSRTVSDCSPLEACCWEDLCNHECIEPYEWEVFEHWIVSPWLAEKLEAEGERIATDFAGLCVWGRTTTGQGIANDSVIERILAGMLRS